MQIKRKRYGISQLEVWFDEPPGAAKVDIIHQRQALQRPLHGWSEDFHTLVAPLTEDVTQIFARIQKRTQTDIRRGDRECLNFMTPEPQKNVIQDFCDFYNDFAAAKKRPVISPECLEPLAEAGMLKFTAAKKDKNVFVWHSYVFTERRVRLLHSASHFRTFDQSLKNAIGRSNKWLHWQDMLYFKKLGLVKYDFGGWYEGSNDLEKLQINRFKESFGAEPELNYNVLYAASAKGRLFLAMVGCYSRLPPWLRQSLTGCKTLLLWRR